MRLSAIAAMANGERQINGRLPTNLLFMTEMLDPEKWRAGTESYPLLCPRSRKGSLGKVADVEDWADYLFIDWNRRTKGTNQIQPSFPLVYDRSFSHHGKGIYVADVAGIVTWDEGARALTRFAKEHPEYAIPLPAAKTDTE